MSRLANVSRGSVEETLPHSQPPPPPALSLSPSLPLPSSLPLPAMSTFLIEATADHWGVRLPGVYASDDLAAACLRRSAESANPFMELTIDVDAKVRHLGMFFGKRSVLKACANATDAIRYIMQHVVSDSGGIVAVGVGSYVGGDEDLIQMSSIERVDEELTEHKHTITIPLPYQLQGTRDLDLERHCLDYVLEAVMASRLRGKPIVGMMLELVLAYYGMELHPEFLHKLNVLLKHLQVKLIIDETMTAARCTGFVEQTHSLLLLDNLYAEEVDYVIVGKSIGIGIVLHRGQSVHTRGTSTDLGGTKMDFAMAVSRALAQTNPQKVEEIRRVYTQRVSRGPNVALWGRGLMLFCSHRLQCSRVDRNQSFRTLPTFSTPVDNTASMSTCSTGASPNRISRSLHKKITHLLSSESKDVASALAKGILACVTADGGTPASKDVWYDRLLGEFSEKLPGTLVAKRLACKVLHEVDNPFCEFKQTKRQREAKKELSTSFTVHLRQLWADAKLIINN